MKLLIIQEYSRHIENVLFRECLCLQRAFQFIGFHVDVWGLGHINYNIIPDFNKYDVILNCENYGDNWLPDLKPYKKPYKILYAIDPHFRGMQPYEHIAITQGYNFLFVAVKNFSIGVNKAWLPPAIDEELFVKKNLPKDIPFGFVGNVSNRGSLLDYLNKAQGLQLHLKIFGDEMVNLINRFNISFNKNISNDTNYRSFETISCGTLLLTDNNPAYKDLGFISGVNCFTYDNVNDINDVLQYLYKNPSIINEVASEGYKLSKKHTYKKRAQGIAEFLKEKI
jgi:Glycosyl transferases group 1